jgi:glycosyltransferase involved in cell wall biosynthesis
VSRSPSPLEERIDTTPRRAAGRRVVLLSNGLRVGGAETQMLSLAEGLVARGDEVALVSILPTAAFGHRVAELDAPLYVTGGDRPRSITTLRRTYRIVRSLQPDALISFTYQANVLGLLVGPAARVPVVVTSLRNERFGSMTRERIVGALRRLGTVEVLNSQRAADALLARGRLRADRTEVIPNALDPAPHAAAAHRRESVRERLGWGQDDVVWLAVGRVEHQKGHDVLLAAFADVAVTASEARLVIVGDGAARDSVAALAAPLGPAVELLGERDDVPDLLAAADGLVLASRWEGLPNVVMEAMAAGLPVVATSVGGTAELVDDGVTGRLVPADDPAALAAALLAGTRDGDAARRAMGDRGRARIAAYSPPAIVERWSTLVDRELRRRPNGNASASGAMPDPLSVPITLFLPTLGGGGAQRVMLAFADLLAARGWDVELVVADASGPLSDVAGRVARVVDLGARSTIAALPRLVRRLRSRPGGLLVATLDHANVVALVAARLAANGTRVAVRSANTTSVVSARATGADRVVYAAARRLFPSADALLAPSAATARDLEGWLGLPDGAVHTVANPVVDGQVLRAWDRPPTHPWFDAGMPPVVVGVGRLVPHKGFLQLLDAFATARAATGARLVLLGDGPQRPELERRAHDLGIADAVDLPGFQVDPFPLMARAHVFVSTSDVEGLPGAVIQALACGTKVVAVDSPGGVAEVLDGGRFGDLVPAGDATALAAAIARALADPPGGPGLDACRRWTEEVAVAELEAVLRHVLGTSATAVESGAGPADAAAAT